MGDLPIPERNDSLVSDTGFFQDLAETIHEALYVSEIPSAKLSYVNPAFERLFGWGAAEYNVDPTHWRRIIHPDDAEYAGRVLERLERGETTRPYRIRRSDGGWRWVRLRHFPRRDRHGTLVRLVGLIADITEEMERAEDARKANESLQRIIEVLPVGILAYRLDTLIFANSMLSQQLAVPPAELLAMPVREIIDTFFREDERSLGQERLRESRRGGHMPPVERHLRASDGAERVVELQTITVDLDGMPAQITIVRDLTEQRRLEAQVAQADRMAALGRIAAGVAHELNNPLSYVLGNLEVAGEELPEMLNECLMLQGKTQQDQELGPRVSKLSERLRNLVSVVHDASDGADRVRAIMRDLKSFSRPDTDDRREPVDIARPLDAAVRMAWREIQPRARLVQDRQSVPLVLGVEGRLCQVFLNLLVNAAEALPDGGSHTHEVRIKTATSASGDAVIEISDTGPGIAPQQLSHLFEPFFTTKGAGRGTGLGLSICHDIVRAHGGQIEIVSAAGEGACFRVTLPAAPNVLPTPSPQATRRGQVLIIDDEPHVAATLRQFLARDHDVTVLSGGREALRLIADGKRFDVIFCDLMMPDVNGMNFHRTLMADARDQGDRIVFMTGGALTPVIREFLEQVPNRHMEKPFTLGDVRQAVSELLQ